MAVVTDAISIDTRGNTDVIDITPMIREVLTRSDVRNGIMALFSPSSTSAVTTIEYESGCIEDLRRFFSEVAPEDRAYAHNARWGDGNGHSHLRAALLKPSLNVPFVDGNLALGTWQQIVFVDFDNRPRRRSLVVQILGE